MNRDKNGRFTTKVIKRKDGKFIITLENEPKTFENASTALSNLLWSEMGNGFFTLFIKKLFNKYGLDEIKWYFPEEAQSLIRQGQINNNHKL